MSAVTLPWECEIGEVESFSCSCHQRRWRRRGCHYREVGQPIKREHSTRQSSALGTVQTLRYGQVSDSNVSDQALYAPRTAAPGQSHSLIGLSRYRSYMDELSQYSLYMAYTRHACTSEFPQNRKPEADFSSICQIKLGREMVVVSRPTFAAQEIASSLITIVRNISQ